MNNTITKRKNGQIEESASTLKARIKKNYAEMQRVAEQATYNMRIALGRDLYKLKRITPDGEWAGTMRELGIAISSGNTWIRIARSLGAARSNRFTSISEHLKHLNPNVQLPRQKVGEQPIRNILAGIDSKILLDREASEKKEGRLKKLVALELVAAGYRALSHKVHSDKGGSDDAMRRLTNVQTTLKVWIEDDLIVF